LKNKEILKTHDKEMKRLESMIKSFVLREDIDRVTDFAEKQVGLLKQNKFFS